MQENSKASESEMVLETLRRRGWCLEDSDQVKAIIVIRTALADDRSKVADSVESELLNSDLRSIGAKSLPEPSLLRNSSYIQGPKILQISSVRDISKSSVADISRNSDGWRLLRLTLTDGHSEITAVEYSHIPVIPDNVVPGTKIRLENKVPVHSGIACLNPKALTVLGGVVQSLYEEWQMNQKYSGFSRSSLRKLEDGDTGGPPPFVKLQVGSSSDYNSRSSKPVAADGRGEMKPTGIQQNPYQKRDISEDNLKSKFPPERTEDKPSGSGARPQEKAEEKPSSSGTRPKEGTVDLEASEPISVIYNRRSFSNKRRNKGNGVVSPLSSTPILKVSDSLNKWKEKKEVSNRKRKLERRNPLSDCTNTSSSSVTQNPIKPNPSPSAIKKPPTKFAYATDTVTNLDDAPNPSSPPSTVFATPLPKTSSRHGTVDLEASEPISVIYNRRSFSNKRRNKGNEVVSPLSSTPILKVSDSLNKWKEKKELAIPISSTTILKVSDSSNKRKDKGKEVAIPISSTPIWKVSDSSNTRKDEGNEVAIPNTSTPIFKVSDSSHTRKDKGKEVLIPNTSTPILKVSDSSNTRKDKGKEVAIPNSSTPILEVYDSSNTRKDKGKEVAIPNSSTPILEVYDSSNKWKDRGMEVAVSTSSSAIKKPPTKFVSATYIATNLDDASNPSSSPSTVFATPLPKTSFRHGTVDLDASEPAFITIDLEASEPISVIYSRRSFSNKRRCKGNAVVSPLSSTPILKVSDSSNKWKDKRKDVAIPISSTPILKISDFSNKRKDKEKEVAIPISSTPIWKVSDSSNTRKDKEKEVAIPNTSTPIFKVSDSSHTRKDKWKEVAIPNTSTPILEVSDASNKRKEKGKEVVIPNTSTPILEVSDSLNTRKDKGKEVAIPNTSTPILEISDSLYKRKDKGKEVDIPSTSTPILEISDSLNKRKDKGKEVVIPASSTPILEACDSSNKRKDRGKGVGVSTSSSAILKASDSREKSHGVGGVNIPKAKALTAPCRKKSRSVLPKELQDYIEKQNAYFKMIDEVELPEEEVESIDELD